MSSQLPSPSHSVLSASKIAVSETASSYWLRQRRVRIDTTTAQHIPLGLDTPETFHFSPQASGQPPVVRYKLPDAVDRVLKISLPDDLRDPLSKNGIYHQTFELFDNDQHHIKAFFRDLDRQMKGSFNSSFVPVNVASICLKDILNAAELNLAAKKRKDLDRQISVTHPMTEASWRASVDGLMETLWAFGATTSMVSFEPSWRLVDPANPPMTQKKWEPGTIRPDVVLASQVLNEPPPSKRADVLRAIGRDSRMYQIITQLQPIINTVETRCLAEFPTVDLSCLIVEYKKSPGSHHIRQLAMAMVTSLHHFCTMGLRGLKWPIFGLLVEATLATLHVGWMNSGGSCQINVINIWDHPQRYEVRGPAVFDLQYSFDALRFCCLLREIRLYAEAVATQVDQHLTEMYNSILENFRNGLLPPKFHYWYTGPIAERT